MLQSPPLAQEHRSQPSLLHHSDAESHAESVPLFKKSKANVIYKLISLCLHRHRHNFLLQKEKKITFPQGTEALPWSLKALPPTPHHPVSGHPGPWLLAQSGLSCCTVLSWTGPFFLTGNQTWDPAVLYRSILQPLSHTGQATLRLLSSRY